MNYLYSPDAQETHDTLKKKPVDTLVFVLLHGLLGMSDNLRMLAKTLQPIGVPVLYDLPNHGQSPDTPNCTFEAMARALHHTLQRDIFVHEQKQVHLIGHSLGGKLAGVYALLYPEQSASLVIMDIAPVEYPPWHTEELRALVEVETCIANNADCTAAQAKNIIARSVSDPLMVGFLMKNVQAIKSGLVCRARAAYLQNNYDTLRSFPRRQLERKHYNKSTLFIRGTRSQYLMPDHYAEVEYFFPTWELEEVNAGHVIHAEKLTDVSALLADFYHSL